MEKVLNAKGSQIYIALLIAVFFVGYLLAKVQSIEQGTPKAVVAGEAITPSVSIPTSTTTPKKVNIGVGHLAALGNKNAKVKIIEFSDFQCPFCRRYVIETFSQIKKDYIDTGKAVYFFRHLPLEFHPAALPAALASECANDQGKFWAMHDKIYEEQAKKGENTIQFTKEDLKIWAQELGIDMAAFTPCLDSEKYKTRVEQDASDGKNSGVNGTPSFFINGTNLVGAQPYSSFKSLIDLELNK